MNRHVRSFIAVATITLAAAPVLTAIANPPAPVPLAERISFARADILSSPCFGPADCRRRIAVHGLDPSYYEAPNDWLECRCVESGDPTACAYLAAWRIADPDGE